MTFRQDLVAVCNSEWRRWGRQTLLADALLPGDVDIQRRNRRGQGRFNSGRPVPIRRSRRADETDLDRVELAAIRTSLDPRRRRRAEATYLRGIRSAVTLSAASTGFEWATAYWREGLGHSRAADVRLNRNPWSAAFISYAFRAAGAGDRFSYSRRHSEYIYHAMNNRLHLIDFANERRATTSVAENRDLSAVGEETTQAFARDRLESRQRSDSESREYRAGTHVRRDPASLAVHLVAYKLDEGYSLGVGDLVCYTRSRARPSWTRPQRRYQSHADVVVAAGGTRIEVIGGNVADAVTKKFLAVSGGALTDGHWNWFCILRNLIA